MGEPAFPGQAYDSEGMPCAAFDAGLSKREWFAGMALPAVIAGIYEGRINLEGIETLSELKGQMVPMAGRIALDIADAMIAQSRKEPKP